MSESTQTVHLGRVPETSCSSQDGGATDNVAHVNCPACLRYIDLLCAENNDVAREVDAERLGLLRAPAVTVRPMAELLDQHVDDLMAEAFALTRGDRAASYGRAEDVFQGYAHIWTGLLRHKLREGVTLEPAEVLLCMVGLKLGREAHKPKRDNVVDAHGYLSLLSRIRGWFK